MGTKSAAGYELDPGDPKYAKCPICCRDLALNQGVFVMCSNCVKDTTRRALPIPTECLGLSRVWLMLPWRYDNGQVIPNVKEEEKSKIKKGESIDDHFFRNIMAGFLADAGSGGNET